MRFISFLTVLVGVVTASAGFEKKNGGSRSSPPISARWAA